MRIGISSYTYTWAIGVPGYETKNRMDAFALLERAKKFEVPVLQIADNLPLHTLEASALDSLCESARSAQIEIQPGTRGIDPEHLLQYLALAQKTGSSIVRTLTDTKTHQPGFAEIVSSLKSVLPAYRAAGVRLALENHDRLSVKEFLAILDSVHDDTLGICLDTVNSFGSLEGPAFVIEHLLPHTINLHIKDFSIQRENHAMGFRITGTPAGQGMLDIPSLFSMIGTAAIDGILELWTAPEADVEDTVKKEAAWADESITYLKQTGGSR